MNELFFLSKVNELVVNKQEVQYVFSFFYIFSYMSFFYIRVLCYVLKVKNVDYTVERV